MKATLDSIPGVALRSQLLPCRPKDQGCSMKGAVKLSSSLRGKMQTKMKSCVAVPQGFTDISLLLEKSFDFLNMTLTFDYEIKLISLC